MKTITKNDRWLVLSPGRTGSVVLSNTILEVYRANNLSLKFLWTDLDKIKEAPNGSLVHCHAEPFPFSTDMYCILNVRDPIDITFSQLIRPYIGRWHLHKRHLNDVKITPFHLNPLDFFNQYTETLRWYRNIPKDFLQVAQIINYENYSKDPLRLVPKLLEIPELDEENFKRADEINLVKNPGPHKSWISNWDLIDQIIKSIEKENKEFFQSLLTKTL